MNVNIIFLWIRCKDKSLTMVIGLMSLCQGRHLPTLAKMMFTWVILQLKKPQIIQQGSKELGTDTVIKLTYIVITFYKKKLYYKTNPCYTNLDLLTELSWRQKHKGIFPEAEVDLFVKVVENCSKPINQNVKCIIFFIFWVYFFCWCPGNCNGGS